MVRCGKMVRCSLKIDRIRIEDIDALMSAVRRTQGGSVALQR